MRIGWSVVIALVASSATLSGCAGRASTGGAPSAPRAVSSGARMDEPYLQERMTRIGPSYESLGKSLQNNQMEAAAKQGEQLAQWFGEVEKFWTYHRQGDAVKWAQEARTRASDAAGAAAAGDATKATTAAKSLGAACNRCHDTYREPTGQGRYQVKAGVLLK
jgi:TolA-binding protein